MTRIRLPVGVPAARLREIARVAKRHGIASRCPHCGEVVDLADAVPHYRECMSRRCRA